MHISHQSLSIKNRLDADHIKNTVVSIIRHIHCLHLLYSEVAWVLVSTGIQVQPKIILDPDYLPNYFSVSYDYEEIHSFLENLSYSLFFLIWVMFQEKILKRNLSVDVVSECSFCSFWNSHVGDCNIWDFTVRWISLVSSVSITWTRISYEASLKISRSSFATRHQL